MAASQETALGSRALLSSELGCVQGSHAGIGAGHPDPCPLRALGLGSLPDSEHGGMKRGCWGRAPRIRPPASRRGTSLLLTCLVQLPRWSAAWTPRGEALGEGDTELSLG